MPLSLPLPTPLAIGASLGLFALWFGFGNLVGRLPACSPEAARKCAHMTIGLTCLAFPWIFPSPAGVIVLGSLAVAGLVAVRACPPWRERLLSCLHGVERESWGEICFATGVTIVFVLSDGDPVLFGVPVLILTVSDAVGALVGGRYGRTAYRTITGEKSAEGSFSFFLSAFLAAHIPLLLGTDLGRAESIVIALILAAMVMLVEAVSERGLDNLLIPLGGYILLSRYLDMEMPVLLGRLALLAVLIACVLVAQPSSSLNGGALLGAVLFAYGAFALGGWPCLVAPVALFVSHLIATRRVRREAEISHTGWAILSIAATGIGWLLLSRGDPVPAFTLGIAVHFTILHHNTLRFLDPRAPATWTMIRSALRCAAWCYLPLIVLLGPAPTWMLRALCALPALLAATALFAAVFPPRTEVSNAPSRWCFQALLASACAAGAHLIDHALSRLS